MSFQPTPLKYNNDDKPGFGPMLMYGLQWFLITIPTVLIISAVAGDYQFVTEVGRTLYTQKLFALTGAGFILQVLFGHKMPLVIGPASVLLIGVMTTETTRMDEVYTAILCGGALMLLISYSGWMKFLQQVFTVRIVIVILALIAFTLGPSIVNLMFSSPVHPFLAYCLGIALIFFMLLLNRMLNGVWKSSVLLWGLLFGVILFRWLVGDSAAASSPAVSAVQDAVAARESSIFLPEFSFDPGVLLSFLFCFIALFINELGSIQSVGATIRIDNMEKRTRKGLRFTGALNMLSGAVGVIGPVDYSLSPGVIMSTGCASRYTLIPAGIGLIVCGMFPGMISFLSAIPKPVMGVILLYVMTTQLSSAFQMIVQKPSLPDFNSCLIVAFPIMIALVVSFMPSSVSAAMPALLRPLLGNGFVMGVITVLLLEHVIFRKK